MRVLASFNKGFCWLEFAGAGDEFFQLAFDGGVADVFLLKDTVGVTFVITLVI